MLLWGHDVSKQEKDETEILGSSNLHEKAEAEFDLMVWSQSWNLLVELGSHLRKKLYNFMYKDSLVPFQNV